MGIRLEMKKILQLLMLCLLLETIQTLNVSSSEELRHPRVTGRIVKLYSGVRPDPILCSGEGFQADPVNCAVFYRCVKGSNDKYSVFRYQCGPGTVYDPDTEVCNHPMNTKRANCGGRQFPDTASANENEIDGSRQEVPSPITTKQPVYTQQTTKVKDITILSSSSLRSASNNNKASQFSTISTVYPWVTSPIQQTQATESTRAVSSKSSRQIGDQCTSDGFMGDSENCRKFYRCVGNGRGSFIRYEFSCSELTIWDDEAQVCNHAWAVKKRRCGRGNLDNYEHSTPMEVNEINPSRTIQSQLQINYGSKVNQVQTQISKGSVIQNQTQINYGNSSSPKTNSKVKQNQTQISHGSAVSQTQTQISHGNNGFQTQLQIDHTKESSQSQTQINEANAEQTNTSPQDDEIQKPNTEKPANGNNSDECTESGFMGDSKDCKKFYRCVDNGRGSYIKYEFSCGEGTVWDPNAEACNHEWAIKDCKNKVTPGESNQNTKTTTSTKAPTQHTTTVNTVTTEDEDVGYGGQNQDQTTTSTTQQNKPSTTKPTTTTTTQSSTTTSKSTTAGAENGCTTSGFMGDSADCNKFYRCVDNGKGRFTKYEYNCGEGTVWDSEIEACNHAWAVKKCGSSSNSASTEKISTSGSSSPTTVTQTITTTSEEDSDSGYGQPQNEATTTSTTTSKQPDQENTNQGNNCTSSGFMGDDKDCKKFYRCVDNGNGAYTRYEFSCGQGTVWDSKIEACNHAWAVKKCGKTTPDKNTPETTTQVGTEIHDEVENVYPSYSDSNEPSQSPTDNTLTSSVSTTTNKPLTDKPTSSEGSCSMEGFFGDTKDCKKFYRCVENQQGGFTKYDFMCGEGTMWDPEINACNHIKSVKNGCSSSTDSMGTTQKQPVHENDVYAESSTSEVTATVTTIESGTEKPSSSSSKCKSEGFYANRDDCKKFYRCVNDGKGGYIKYDFSCGDGTIWDEQAQTCNHESSQTKCSQNAETGTSEKPESNSEATTQTELVTASTTSKKPSIDSTTSNNKDQCTSEGFHANSNDCKKFFRCVDNGNGGYTKYDFSCGDGTVWVQEIQACDHDNNISNCNSQMVSSTSSYQEEQHSSTDSSTSAQSSTTEKQNDDTSSAQSGTNQSTSNECNSEGFFANKKDCRKFYRCVDNGKGGFTLYDFSCGEGTAWDSEIEACNHIDQVQNCQRSENENQSDSSTVDEKPSQTTEGTSTTKTSTTQSPDENQKPLSTDKCENEGYFGNSQDCKKFYRCVDNGKGGLTKYDYTCGEGTIWDQDILACNHPRDVQNPSCDNNTSETATESSNDGSSAAPGSSTTSSGATSSSTEGQDSSDCSQSSTQKPHNKNVNCTKAGFYADPDDCKKFYRCVDWDNNGQRFSVYHFDCGEGTIWDPELETCNHEDSVYPPRDCSEKQTQNTTDESTTTTEKTTTSDSSTQESTTTEESTTEMTSEQTSQTTTSTTESATTQQSTEATTASTTQQSTTTQQSSSTEQSTTKNEQTTTQQSTTSERTTTQQSTTTQEETTTTEQSTTEQSTTEQSTTEKSTTEQSTTEQSTTEQSTTEQSTTEQSTTEQNTTEQSTTEQSTTEQSTTEQSTTEQSTTEQSTTEQSTTEQSTTEQSTNEQSTTEQSTTEQSTTEQSTTEQSTTEQSTTEQSITEQSTTEQSTTEQSTTEQSTTEQSTTEHSTTEQSSENSSEQSSTTEETTTQESSTTESSTTESSTTEQSSSTTDQESTTESSSNSKECPETDDDQYVYVCPTSFKRHPKYCNMFYQCTEEDDSRDLHIAVFKCPNNTIYDESKTQCVDKEKADKKCEGEIEERKRVKRLNTNFKEPIIVSKEPLVCPGTGHYPFEKSECSPAFLKCNETKTGRLRGYVHRCPEGYVYWSISRRCETKASVRDCKQTANDWRGRWEIPTERKNIAT